MSDAERGDALARLRQLELELPERGTGARAARRSQRGETAPSMQPRPAGERPPPRRPLRAPAARPPRPSPRWMAVFSGLLVLAVVAGSVLTYVGVQTVRDSTAGRTLASTDPSEPGFEGFLEPTPTLLVVHESGGALRSLALIGLASHDTGGAVLLVPPSMRVESEDYAGPLSVAYAFGGGIDSIFHHVEALLGVGITEHVIVDDGRWSGLTAPVAPLVVDDPDAVVGFEPGPIQLAADDVSSWLATVDGEGELSRMVRVQRFWEAWLAAVAEANDPGAVPGEVESGIGRFVRGLSAGAREVAVLPVLEDVATDGSTVLRIDPAPAAELVAEVIPFPRGHVEGARTRVRLLDGTGTPDHALDAAPLIVRASAEIVIVGNAETFEQPRPTEVRYHAASQEEAAERLRDALGAGVVVADARQVDSFDVTIVLGTDI